MSGEYFKGVIMKCPYCNEEFSNKVIKTHLDRCSKNPKNKPKKTRKKVVKKDD